MKINYRLLLVTACLFLLFACGNQGTDNTASNLNAGDANPTPANNAAHNQAAPDAGNTPDPAPTTADQPPEFEGTAGITHKENRVSGVTIMREVRTGQHERYDRVVFEFEGAELPGYHIEYIDKPVRQCGSGNAVAIKGDGWLEIRMTPAQAHTEDGQPTIRMREQSPNHKIIREIELTCDFEADVTWVVGTASPNRYRVSELRDPTRLVVDIKH